MKQPCYSYHSIITTRIKETTQSRPGLAILFALLQTQYDTRRIKLHLILVILLSALCPLWATLRDQPSRNSYQKTELTKSPVSTTRTQNWTWRCTHTVSRCEVGRMPVRACELECGVRGGCSGSEPVSRSLSAVVRVNFYPSLLLPTSQIIL
jgi:hypothetical protein